MSGAPLSCADRKLLSIGYSLADNGLDPSCYDLLASEARLASLIAKVTTGHAGSLPEATALEMATLGGARALGLDHMVGSIEAGKQADLAIVDMSPLETQPLHHVASQLAYATGRHQVSDVWIAGKPKLRDRALVDMDPDALVANARQWRQRIAATGHLQ